MNTAVQNPEEKISEALDPNPKYCINCGQYLSPELKLLLAIFGEDEQVCPECSDKINRGDEDV